jgi:hypothetical protein
MIKNRNIAPDAYISASKIASNSYGEILHVCRISADYNWLQQRIDQDHLFKANGSTGVAFDDALAKCVSYRNDLIIVHDGPYGIATTIDLGSLASVHLIGANGLSQSCGSMGGAYIVQSAAYPVITLGNWCEVAGLQIWNYTGEEGIYQTTKQGNHIHHNFFRLTASAAISSGVQLAGGYGSNYNRIEFNKFKHYAGTAGGYVIGGGSGTGNDVCNNEIVIYGSVVYDVGINFPSEAAAQINDNTISDCGGSGTITVGILAKTTNGTTLIGNRVALPTGTAFSGGTANKSFCQNFDAQAGGATAIES